MNRAATLKGAKKPSLMERIRQRYALGSPIWRYGKHCNCVACSAYRKAIKKARRK